MFECKVWPSIWTKGNDWPNNGEIDIIEGVNKMNFNQMAVHTKGACTAATGTDQTGGAGNLDCTQDAGCTVVRLCRPRVAARLRDILWSDIYVGRENAK